MNEKFHPKVFSRFSASNLTISQFKAKIGHPIPECSVKNTVKTRKWFEK